MPSKQMVNNQHLQDAWKGILANGTILGVVTMAEAELFLKIVLLILTIAYTAVKLWKAVKQPTTKQKEENE